MNCTGCGEQIDSSWFSASHPYRRTDRTLCGLCYYLILNTDTPPTTHRTRLPLLETVARIGALNRPSAKMGV
jgi:hypothetical protein